MTRRTVLLGLAAIFLLHSGPIASGEIAEQPTVKPWSQGRKIWFEEPAQKWNVALPVGNGRMGAMVLGTYPKERIQLNEDSIWAQTPIFRHPPDSKKHFDKMQELCEQGDYEGAHKVFVENVIMTEAGRVGSYQTLGDLWITHVAPSAQVIKMQGYRRDLDLATGVATVTKPLADGSIIVEKVISSPVDNRAGGALILDGNYGATAGIAEMLIQSHDGEVHLLPALPDAWKDGSVKGLVARGAFEVDLYWKAGKLERADILSRKGGPLTVRVGNETSRRETIAGQEISLMP